MSEAAMMEVLSSLSKTVSELEYSVMQAYDQFLMKYGPGHEYSNRLESYFPAIDKQWQYISEFEQCYKSGQIQTCCHIATKIRALSVMIKDDAKSFLASMNPSLTTEETQEDLIH